MSGLISSVLVIITLLFPTPLFEQLPFVALAAIVLVAGIGLFDIPELRRLWTIQRSDFVLAIITAFAVAVIGMLQGILIAVVLSLLDVSRRSWPPHTAELVGVPGTDTFRDSDHVEGGEVIPGLVIYRFDAPLFFANATVMSKEIVQMVASQGTPVEMVLFDAESVHDVDTTAVHVLEDLIEDLAEDLAEAGITFTVARLRTAVRESLDVAGVIDRIGEGTVYFDVDDGVGAYLQHGDGR